MENQEEHEKEKHEEHHHEEKQTETHHHGKKEAEKETKHDPEKKDLRDTRTSILVFTLAGAGMGILSSLLKSMGISNWITAASGFIILIVLSAAMEKLLRRKIKFFMASLLVYLVIWLVNWIFLFNLK